MRALLIVIGLVAVFAAGVVATLLITGWDPSDDEQSQESVAIVVTSTTATVVTSTAPESDPLAEACEVVWDYFVPMMDHQEKLFAGIRVYRDYETFRKANLHGLRSLLEETEVVVSKSADLATDGNPDGEALLNYAISSRSIAALALRENGLTEWSPVLDDADEFRAYEIVVARCQAASR